MSTEEPEMPKSRRFIAATDAKINEIVRGRLYVAGTHGTDLRRITDNVDELIGRCQLLESRCYDAPRQASQGENRASLGHVIMKYVIALNQTQSQLLRIQADMNTGGTPSPIKVFSAYAELKAHEDALPTVAHEMYGVPLEFWQPDKKPSSPDGVVLLTEASSDGPQALTE